MKPKSKCEECNNLGQANALRKSQVDYRRLCFRCYNYECSKTKKAKLSHMNKDNYEMHNLYKKDLKGRKVMHLLKNGVVLMRGEGEVLIGSKLDEKT